jgi:hypothetical protein
VEPLNDGPLVWRFHHAIDGFAEAIGSLVDEYRHV